ncbi:ArsR/SmtB family transcription factor [Pontiella agarivorans]|uniref:HTH arsR-type domain-containing protein n=1 Tax=Pontiella agarivorans TaxID=3038953 RepID=A0ABU5MSQ9_9BACT|nr:hypothetical protein [Pontiella agarivorans]MDZ8117167.1 hypothetical protein [Pontiella agarivorans]
MSEDLIWRQLRVLANPLRIEMLTLLSTDSKLYVQRIGELLGCAEDIASKHLQRLGDGGFLRSWRRGRYLYYGINTEHPLVAALLEEIDRPEADIGTILKSLTAFTHERRIQIVRSLMTEPKSVDALRVETGISGDALLRHLRKLEAREMVFHREGCWSVAVPRNRLRQWLMEYVTG